MGETGLEKYLGSVLDTVAEGIEIIDADGYYSFANLAAERMFGPREELIGRRYDDTRWRLTTPDGLPIPPEDMPQTQVMRTGEAVLDTLLRAILPDGRQVVLTMNAVPFPDESGRVVGTLVSYIDVTQRSRRERLDSTLLDIGVAVNSSFDFDTILQRALDLAVEALGCESGILFLKEGADWVIRFLSNLPEDMRGERVPDELASFTTLTGGKAGAIAFNDAYEDDRIHNRVMRRFRIRSLLDVTLRVRDHDIADVSFIYQSAAMPFTEDEVAFADKFGAIVGLALESSELYQVEKENARLLQESEMRLRIAAEAAALGVHDYDVAAGTIGWDERVREIWGSPDEGRITYGTFMSGVHPDDREATQAAVDAALDPAGSGHYLVTFRVLNAADGTVRWVAATGQVLFEAGSAAHLVGMVEDITGRRRLEEALRDTELAAAAQDERNRLARELHDSVTQALFAATLKAEALAQSEDPLPGWVVETVEELRRLSRGALAQMRTLLLELRHEPIEQIPIEQLLRQLVEAMEGRVGTACQLTIRGEAALPPQLHVTIYRIVQEALSNVSRHAGASRASVLLEMHPGGRVHLSVEDDGRGFDPDTVDPSHLGLRSMQERADQGDAALEVSTRSGRGTVVTLDWTADEKSGV